MSATAGPPEDDRGTYLGWIAGGAVIVGILLIGAAFWFIHHP